MTHWNLGLGRAGRIGRRRPNTKIDEKRSYKQGLRRILPYRPLHTYFLGLNRSSRRMCHNRGQNRHSSVSPERSPF